jgi:nitrite reductase/ring-hydroxylating ferredoxin subunit
MVDDSFVPKERYLDRTFFEMENEHLWPYVWQMAARLEEIPNPGDYSEYQIAGNSVLIVRQSDGSVKALHNVCRHRATELATGCGQFPGGQIVCPFHGWRWNTDGSSSHVFMESHYKPDCLDPEGLRLPECKVEVWAGCVWINFDEGAARLSEAFAPVVDVLDALGVDRMRVKWWQQIVLDANWKMTMEAFMEGFHAPQTHPQTVIGPSPDMAVFMSESPEYVGLPGGHGRFYAASTEGILDDWGWNGDDFIENARVLADGLDALTLDRDVAIFEGIRNKVGVDNPKFAEAAVMALYEYAAGAGIPMPAPSEHMAQWGAPVFIFPNTFMFPMYGNCLCYRMRPHDGSPERTLFDMWSLTTYPEGEEPGRAQMLGVFDKDDAEHWRLIPRQDFSNIERQQRGLHSRSFDRLRFSTDLERLILNLHEHIDRVIAAGVERSTRTN